MSITSAKSIMKAAIYKGKDGIEIDERAIPEMGEKDIIVRNLLAGICGTDINIVKVGRTDQGIENNSEFGHEMVGQVVKTGRFVPIDIKVGMKVGINPITAKRAGRRHSLQCGGFSQYITVEDAELGFNVFEIDESVPWEAAVLMEPMSVGRHGAFRTNPKQTDKVVILGAGPIGLLAALSLLCEKISHICIVDVDPFRLQKAEEFGIKTVNTAQVGLEDGLKSIFGSVDVFGSDKPDVDIFVDAAGAPGLLTQVLDTARTGSVISVIAVYKNAVPVDMAKIMSKEITILGSSGYESHDIEQVVGYLNSGTVNLENAVTHVFKLEDIELAFQTAISGKGTVKVLVDLC